jgi:TonB family protein
VLHQVLPNPSQGAKNTIHGRIKVRVRVRVDGAGNVADASFISAGPSKYFSRLAMEAAQQWKFAAPAQSGRAIPSEWVILFEFARGGTQAVPQPVRASQ